MELLGSILGLQSDDIVGIMAILVVFAIPIVAVLTRHQQRMAQILHDRQGAQPLVTDRLAEELAHIRQVLAQHTIALDNLAIAQRQLATQSSLKLESRLENSPSAPLISDHPAS